MIERPQRGGEAAARVDVRGRARGFDEVLKRARSGMGQARAPSALAAVQEAKQPCETLARRRVVADGKDTRLGERREELERAGDAERRPCAEPREAPRPAGPPPPRLEAATARAPTPASLAAAVEKLSFAVERRDRADPSLTMRFGEGLSMRLAHGGRGLELSIAGDRAAARAARAELPSLVSKLRERGIVVARAEVRALTATGGSARTGLLQSERNGTVAKW